MRITAASLVFVAVGTATAGLLATLSGILQPWAAAVGLLAGAIAAVFATRALAKRSLGDAPALSRWELAAAALFAVVALRQFGWLLFTEGSVVRTADVYNFGDLPLHITYTELIARGAAFWPANPILTGERLRYPIGMDLWNAMLLQLGVPLRAGLVATGLVASAFFFGTLRRWGGPLAVTAFVLSGGLEVGGLSWLNLFLSLFVPQRGFLFALPAGLLLLLSWRERLVRRSGPGLPPWIEGVLWGALPLFHLHTFLFVSVVLALWTVARRQWRESLVAFGVAVVPATLGVLAVTDQFRAAALVGWAPGWVIGGRPVLAFLAKNFGLLVPIAAALLVVTLRRRVLEWRLCVLPALAIWAALFFFKLAPWAWDNTKVMVWCFLLLLPPLSDLARSLKPWIVAVLLVLWLAPGTATLLPATFTLRHDLDVYDVEERREVCAAVASLPRDARVATVATFNHPVALCGQPLVEGYAGHLWSHGLDARAVDADLSALFLGAPDWPEAARRLRARYLFWGARERVAYGASSRAWATAPVVAEGPWGRLYALPE